MSNRPEWLERFDYLFDTDLLEDMNEAPTKIMFAEVVALNNWIFENLELSPRQADALEAKFQQSKENLGELLIHKAARKTNARQSSQSGGKRGTHKDKWDEAWANLLDDRTWAEFSAAYQKRIDTGASDMEKGQFVTNVYQTLRREFVNRGFDESLHLRNDDSSQWRAVRKFIKDRLTPH